MEFCLKSGLAKRGRFIGRLIHLKMGGLWHQLELLERSKKDGKSDMEDYFLFLVSVRIRV